MVLEGGCMWKEWAMEGDEAAQIKGCVSQYFEATVVSLICDKMVF